MHQKLRARRKELGLSQRQLSVLVGTSQPTICRWETGQDTPNLVTGLRLAAVLGIDDPNDLISEPAARPPLRFLTVQELIDEYGTKEVKGTYGTTNGKVPA